MTETCPGRSARQAFFCPRYHSDSGSRSRLGVRKRKRWSSVPTRRFYNARGHPSMSVPLHWTVRWFAGWRDVLGPDSAKMRRFSDWLLNSKKRSPGISVNPRSKLISLGSRAHRAEVVRQTHS